MILNINTGLPLPHYIISDLVKNVIFYGSKFNFQIFIDMLFRCQTEQLLVTATYPYPTDLVKIYV